MRIKYASNILIERATEFKFVFHLLISPILHHLHVALQGEWKKNSNNWRTDGESMVRPVCVCVYCVCVLMKNAFVPLFYRNINEIGRMANANGILMCYSCITHAQFFAEWVNEPAVWLLSVHATINKIDIRSSNNGKKWILKTTRVSEWVSTCAIWNVIKCVVEPSSSAIFAWVAAFIY